MKICTIFVFFVLAIHFTNQQLSFYEQNIIDKSNSQDGNKNFSILGSEYAKLKYFKNVNENISKKYKEIETCLDNLTWDEFEQETIENCTGTNVSKLKNFFFYEKKKILAQAEGKVSSIFVYYCYSQANEDIKILQGCDLFERDVKDLLWMELNFFELIKNHFQRYIQVQGQLPTYMFTNLLRQLKIIQNDYNVINNEFEDHRQLSLLRIERFIHQKIKNIEKLQQGNEHDQSIYDFSDQEENEFDFRFGNYQGQIEEMNNNKDDYFAVRFNNDLMRDFKELKGIKKK